jgi:hypothetical protein
VTLIVGKEKKAYILHKNLLCLYSDYFRAAFNGQFKETTERKLELPDVETSLFDEFQVWLYTRELQGPPGLQFRFLTDMWILGDQHQIPLLQNQAMDKIFAKRAENNCFAISVVPEVFAKTAAGSPLRKAVIEIIAFVEATDRKIDLFDANQEAFEHFLTWLYTRKLASDDEQPLGLIALVDLWLLGDRFQVPMLQNCVMDKIIPQPNDDTVFELGLVEAAYENTTVGSPLRRVLLEIPAYQTALGEAEGVLFRKRFTVEILVDLVKEVASARKDKVPWGELPKRDKCFFHVHGKDEQC